MCLRPRAPIDPSLAMRVVRGFSSYQTVRSVLAVVPVAVVPPKM
jgi:hypothetical protein